MAGGVRVQLAEGDHQVEAVLFVPHPHGFQVMLQGHRGRDCIVAMRAVDRTGVRVLAQAAGVAEALASTDARHHRGRQALGDQRRALLDVQFQIGAYLRAVKKRPAFPDGLRIEAALQQCRLQRFAVVRSLDGEAGWIQQPERAAAAEIRNIEP